MGSNTESPDDGGIEQTVARVRSWTMLDGSRMALAGITSGVVLAFVLVVSLSRFSPLSSHQPLYYAFGGLLSGNLTIITVVVSINQLLLSRELQTPKELRSEIDGMVDYRRDIEDSAGQVAPVEPLGFLRLIIETTRQRAQRLGGISISETDEDVSGDVDDVVTEITAHADRVDDLLQEGNVATFRVLSTTLETNYAKEINQLRRIEVNHGDRLPSDVTESLDDLVHLLEDIDVARQYLKSIYLQQELASLSRILFFTGLPAVAIVTTTLLVFTTPAGTAIPRSVLTVLIPVVLTVGLFPLTVLFSYILRTATVARRTAAIIPFTAPAQEE